MTISPSILTAIGRAKLASATPEQQLRIAHVAVGDGGGQYGPINDGMESLAREVWRGEASAPLRDPGNASVLMFEAYIPANVGGFFIREMAIFDADGDMIGIGQITLIEKLGTATGVSPITLTVRFRLLLSNTSDVTLIYQDAPALSHAGLSERNQYGAHTAAAISYQPRTGGDRITVQEAIDRAFSAGGVTLSGPGMVNKGGSGAYEITNFDSFSVYSASTTVGTVTRAGSTITLNIPANAWGVSAMLHIERNGVTESFVVAINESFVAAPFITSPATAAEDVPPAPLFKFSAFAAVPAGVDTHRATRLQIASDSNFASPEFDSGEDTDNLSAMQIPLGVLQPGVRYYSRAKHFGHTLGSSDWGEGRMFNVANQYVKAPVVTVQGAPSSVPEQPVLTTAAFSVYNGSDTHASTNWVVRRVSDSAIVWQSLGNTLNKTSITVPAGVLQVSTDYTFSAQHVGQSLGASPAGTTMSKTAAEFFTFSDADIGRAYGGGYFAGRIQQSDGVYALIVAPKSAESNLAILLPETATVGGGGSLRDGLSNSVYVASQLQNYAAAKYCRGYLGGGHSDWYLPAKNELEILYRNLKPTATANSTTGSHGQNPDSVPPNGPYTAADPARAAAALFQSPAAESFSLGLYWSSSSGNTNNHWAQRFDTGNQAAPTASALYVVRPVRRIKISS